MVMHARKQSKLNDGYADRPDTHLYQDMQYHSSLFADDSDDDGPLGGRIGARYQNKSSYIERNKEKRGSLSLGKKKVSHYLVTGSLGRPIPLDTDFNFSGEHSSTSGIPDPTPSSSGQRNERSGSLGERGVRDCNNQSGIKSEQKSSATPSSSSLHHQTSEHAGRSSMHQHSGGGDYTSQSEKDNPSSSSSSAANNGKQTTSTGKDKEQVQKSAIRVCGDWSEHISSSGKRYYYNCKTEVSQWEKPKEWNSEMCKTPDHRSKDGRPRVLSQSHANKITADNRASRHSSSCEHQQREHARSHCVNSGDIATDSQTGRDPTLSNAHQHYKDGRESRDNSRDNSVRDSRDAHKCNLERTRSGDSTSSNSYPHYHHYQGASHRPGSVPGGNNGVSDTQHADYKRLQQEGQYSSHGDYKRSGSETSRRRRTDSQGSQRYLDTGQGPVDDMDISPSPSPSPSSSRPSSTSGTPQLPPTSTPIAVSSTPSHSITTTPGGGHRSSSPLGNPIPTLVNRQPVTEGGSYDKTIQTLQELHKVLSMHIRAQQNTTNIRPTVMQPQVRHPTPVSFHQGTPSQHLIYPVGQSPSGPSMGVLPHHSYQGLQSHMPASTGIVPSTQTEDGLGGRTSPVSATSSRSSCGSPTPSDSSSQNAAVTSQALTAAAMKREETAKLTASLSNYYNEKLIGHVLGWQADLQEKQAAKLWEESMVTGSEQCSRISVQLKRARSQVRIAEIQSTLHEQRIMSSEQQRQEIENLKMTPSFLPS